MNQKFFPADKNYILKEAQQEIKEELKDWLYREVLNSYLLLFNPLGLEDDTILKIKSVHKPELPMVEVFYQKLTVIYRYRYGSNQLEFTFDGRTHQEIYQEAWTETFKAWTREFCMKPQFLRMWIETAVFHSQDKFMLESVTNRSRLMIEKHFSLKLDKRKGLVVLS
jgi:hypothetical protein